MDIKPNIRSNFGPLSPRGFNKIAAKANERTTRDATRDLLPGTKVFIAVITGNTTIISNRRWKYNWSQSYLKSSNKLFTQSSTYLVSATGTEAYNTCEALQQDTTSNPKDGPGITHSSIPSGFLLQPIATGTNVLMFQSRDDLGAVTFVFSLANAIDGTCA